MSRNALWCQWWTEVGVIVMFVAESVRIGSITLDELQTEMEEAAKTMRKRKLGDVVTSPEIIKKALTNPTIKVDIMKLSAKDTLG